MQPSPIRKSRSIQRTRTVRTFHWRFQQKYRVDAPLMNGIALGNFNCRVRTEEICFPAKQRERSVR